LFLLGDTGVSSDEVDGLMLTRLILQTISKTRQFFHFEVELFIHLENHPFDGVFFFLVEKFHRH